MANPAADAPLPGAEQEGHEVADALEAFNAVWEEVCENRIEVVRLIGPKKASRCEVFEHLMLRRYDVLHFAGHCVYVHDQPTLSGWVFGRDLRLSAFELNRIDRVPRFVFSNACESGVLSGRADTYAPGMRPALPSRFSSAAWPISCARPGRSTTVRRSSSHSGFTTVFLVCGPTPDPDRSTFQPPLCRCTRRCVGPACRSPASHKAFGPGRLPALR